MGLTISEAARLIDVKENVVRGYISTGKLAFDIQDGRIVIPRSAVEALLHPERQSVASESPGSSQAGRSPHEEALRSVLKELFVIEDQLDSRWDLFSENQKLHQLLRDKDGVLAERNAEIERLKREAMHQRRHATKEVEDRERAIEERLRGAEEEAARRVAREQELCNEKVALVDEHWARRVAEERERSTRGIAEAGKQEGFWARLVKMMTWS
jgi:hypothetical protein